MSYHPPYCDPSTFIFALLYLNDEFIPFKGGYRVPTLDGEYKIHGLWPETCKECLNCGYPSYCRKVHFNRSALDPIYNKLQKDWYPDKGLFQHEWLKHGSCYGNVTEYEYFNRVLRLWSCIPFRRYCKGNKEECRILLTSKQIEDCLF